MIPQRFNEIVKRRLQLIDETLGFKGQEYAGGQEDRLHNFKLGAEIQQITPAECLRGYWTKHVVSILDIITLIARGKKLPSPAVVDEKIGDAINYLILLEGVIEDARQELERKAILTHSAEGT